MVLKPTVLLVFSSAIFVLFTSQIISHQTSIHPAVWSLIGGVVYLLFVNSAKLVPALILPLFVIVPTSIYFAQHTISFDLVSRFLLQSEYAVVNSCTHKFYSIIIVPVVMLLPGLKPESLVSDLSRYGFRRWPSLISYPVLIFLEIVLIVELGKTVFHRISCGLSARYISLEGYNRLLHLRTWSSPLIGSVLISAIHRRLYLKTTGINVKCKTNRQDEKLYPNEIALTIISMISICLFIWFQIQSI